jgi:uncharacterized membrane protein
MRRYQRSGTRRALRVVLLIIGVLALAMGLLWIGQGTGLVPWPKSSFMISEMAWAWRGAVLAVIGAGVIFASRRV